VFPARQQSAPLSPTSFQKIFNAVVRQSGIPQDASIQTLRHSYATHLFEWGVPLRVIQELLGHKSPSTTARYPHVTSPTLDIMHATISALMADL
jgi:integrase/recombinase XerD